MQVRPPPTVKGTVSVPLNVITVSPGFGLVERLAVALVACLTLTVTLWVRVPLIGYGFEARGMRYLMLAAVSNAV